MKQLIVRLARTFFVLSGITVFLFVLIRLPGSGYALSEAGLNSTLPLEERLELVRRYRLEYHLDEPILDQFTLWAGRLVRGDLGRSMIDQRPVTETLMEVLPATLWIQGLALILMFGAGVPLGVQLGKRTSSRVDRWVSAVLLGVYSIPSYWLATLFILYLGTGLGVQVFPIDGLPRPFASEWSTLLHSSVLPVVVTAIPGLVMITRQTRQVLAEALTRGYVTTLRAAGIPETTVVKKYALRETAGPLCVLFGALIPNLVTGSVIVENIFNINGLGRLVYQASFERDYPTLQALFLLSSLGVLSGYLIADLLAWLFDPRLRRPGVTA